MPGEAQLAAPVARAAARGGQTSSLRGGPPPTRGRPREVTVDYGYVVSDLRRIAMIGGGLVLLLVALSFIVR
ncbi:MAG: hypothetical protein HY534_04225 [Chloroflexi bacterium]|nr:hypothetical protein [Chloroflexota bacterium]